MNNHLTVSVIIPTFNYANYIIEAIASVTTQTYAENLIEIIIIDDGSTDNTQKVLKPYIEEKSIIYHYQENNGKASATQKGIDLSTGDIICNLDADDYFYPNKIEEIVNVFQNHENVMHVGHLADVMKDNKLLYTEEINAKLLNKPIAGEALLTIFLKERLLFGGGSTFAARATSLKKIKIPNGVDMYIDEYLIYATTIFGGSYFLPKPLSVWRVHGKNYSVDRSKTIVKEKNNRLLSSSTAMLIFLSESKLYSQQIIRLYELKHLDRFYNFKEEQNSKRFADIMAISKKILSFRYSFSDLYTYRIPFRLIPTFLIKILKK